MPINISPYKKSSQKQTATINGLNTGISTSTIDDLMPSSSFTRIENGDLTKYGSLRPRTGFKQLETFEPIVNNVYIKDFDRTNFQGIITINNTNQNFFIIDGLLFNEAGKDLTQDIQLWLIFEFDDASSVPQPSDQFNLKQVKVSDLTASNGNKPMRLNRKVKDITASFYFGKLYIPISLENDFQYTYTDSQKQPQTTKYKHNTFLLVFDNNSWSFILPFIPNFTECGTLGYNNLVYSYFNEAFAGTNAGSSATYNDFYRKLNYYVKDDSGALLDSTNFAKVLDINHYPLEPIRLEKLNNITSNTQVNSFINPINPTSPVTWLGSIDAAMLSMPDKWFFVDTSSPDPTTNISKLSLTMTYSDGTSKTINVSKNFNLFQSINSPTYGKVYVWNSANQGNNFLTTNDFNTLDSKDESGVAPWKLATGINNYITEGKAVLTLLDDNGKDSLKNELIKCVNNNLLIISATLNITPFSIVKNIPNSNSNASPTFDIKSNLEKIFENFQNNKNFTISNDFQINFKLNISFSGNGETDLYYVGLNSANFVFNGTMTGTRTVDRNNDNIVFFKANFASSQAFDYKTDISVTDTNNKIWYIYPWVENKDLWSENIWSSKPAFDPSDPTKAITPYEPDFTKWIPIIDNPSLTNQASILRLWSPSDWFLVGCEFKKSTTDNPPKNYDVKGWKLINLNNDSKDYFVDFRQIASCDKSKVINQQLFIWNGDYTNDNSQTFAKNNRIFISQINNFAYFPSDNFIDLDITDKEIISDIIPFQNGYIIITTYNIFYLSGDNPSNFAIKHLNKSIGSLYGNSVVAYTNFIYFINGEGIWRIKSLYNIEDRANIDKISKPIEEEIYFYLTDYKNVRTIIDGELIYWYFPNDKLALKYYPLLSQSNGLDVWSMDTSDIFSNLKNVNKDNTGKLILWTYDQSNGMIGKYYKTQWEENFFIDGTASAAKTYPFFIQSINESLGMPMNNKQFYNIFFKFGLPSESKIASLNNLDKLQVGVKIYIDDNLAYGQDKYEVLGNQLVIKNESSLKNITQGLALDYAQSSLNDNQLGKATEVIKSLAFTGRGNRIKYELMIKNLQFFELTEVMFIFKEKRASLQMGNTSSMNKNSYIVKDGEWVLNVEND